jgi:hypothetical protein
MSIRANLMMYELNIIYRFKREKIKWVFFFQFFFKKNEKFYFILFLKKIGVCGVAHKPPLKTHFPFILFF